MASGASRAISSERRCVAGALVVACGLLAVPALIGSPQASRAREPQEAPAIPRFAQVAPGLYRGGQPTREGLAWLKAKGIRTVVSLRSRSTWEREAVEALGMRYVHVPVSLLTGGLPLNPWKRVPDASVEAFLRIVGDEVNRPVFVHCLKGADRTGAMVAFYRVIVEGWDAEDAYREARRHGLHWWFRGIKRQIHAFAAARDEAARAIAVPAPGHEARTTQGALGVVR